MAFLIGEEKIMAHKCILATRCSYFARMFQTKMKETNSNEVEVTDIRPEIFRLLIKYIYSGQEPKCWAEDAMDLLSAADKYGLDELKKMCESFLCCHLSSDNVIELLLLADSHNCSKLMQHATTTFKMYLGDLKNDERWKKLMRNPDLLLKLMISCYHG